MAEKVEKRKIGVNGFFSALALSALRCRITVFCGNIYMLHTKLMIDTFRE